MSLLLEDVWITQEALRKCCQLERMIEFVRGGGFWTRAALNDWSRNHGMPEKTPLIQVSRFEDGKRFWHDGHHRIVATYAGGRDFLREDEYEIADWTYALYLQNDEEALENHWYTPFDPRTEVRLEDFNGFKSQVFLMLSFGFGGVVEFISKNKDRYCRSRKLHTVKDLWEVVRPTVKLLSGSLDEKKKTRLPMRPCRIRLLPRT